MDAGVLGIPGPPEDHWKTCRGGQDYFCKSAGCVTLASGLAGRWKIWTCSTSRSQSPTPQALGDPSFYINMKRVVTMHRLRYKVQSGKAKKGEASFPSYLGEYRQEVGGWRILTEEL